MQGTASGWSRPAHSCPQAASSDFLTCHTHVTSQAHLCSLWAHWTPSLPELLSSCNPETAPPAALACSSSCLPQEMNGRAVTAASGGHVKGKPFGPHGKPFISSSLREPDQASPLGRPAGGGPLPGGAVTVAHGHTGEVLSKHKWMQICSKPT